MAAAIRASGLGKRYTIGARERYGSLRDSVARALAFGSPRSPASSRAHWALRDVSFEVEQSRVFGVIGHNGAGKSTLLKLLSRITSPTAGSAELRGRVGSLLEVGTGFHPELTGRENIFLNGAILGMRRAEIVSSFDDIVAFAEIGKFLDTPVKRYSSGMYVRLAFAVAAHLRTEILLIDEVLAVGDAAFQRKCIGKMEEVTGQDRTIVFVSHNMAAMKALATTCMWLDSGGVRRIGPTNAVVDEYLATSTDETARDRFPRAYMDAHRAHNAKYVGTVALREVALFDDAGRPAYVHLEGSRIRAELTAEVLEPVEAFEVYVRIRGLDGQLLSTCLPGRVERRLEVGIWRATVSISTGDLLPGTYRGDVVLLSQLPQDSVAPAFQFEVAPGSTRQHRTVLFGTGSAEQSYANLGVVYLASDLLGIEPLANDR